MALYGNAQIESEIVFIGFGNSPEWDTARKRILQSITSNFPSASLFIKDEAWLKKTLLYSQHKEFFKNYKKGYGLWAWKPQLILDAMESFPNKKIFVYIDLGCELNINSSSLNNFLKYINITDTKLALAFEGQLTNKDYTSDIVLRSFNAELFSKNQIFASILFFKNEKKVKDFINRWKDLSISNNFLFLIGGSSQKLIDTNQHRHDQSILSLIWRETEFAILPDESYWLNWAEGSNAPIWTARNRLQISINSKSYKIIIFRIIRKIEILIHKLKS